MNVTAALALKKVMERNRLPGTIRLWPGVAEEQVATKAHYVRAGLFKDVDVVLFAHAVYRHSAGYRRSRADADEYRLHAAGERRQL